MGNKPWYGIALLVGILGIAWLSIDDVQSSLSHGWHPSSLSRFYEPLVKRVKVGLSLGKKDVCDWDPTRHIFSYAVVIDAGSTGSRVHIYRFDNCGNATTPTLHSEVFKQITPGLSSFADDPQRAAHSLDPLLKKAVASIPKSLHSCTPVSLKATAGLRLLGEGPSEDILEAVRDRIETKYPFPIYGGRRDGIAIMDGADEGVYAWITVNYLLGNFNRDTNSSNTGRKATAGILDLGGGSTQLVFEPEFNNRNDFINGEHKYKLDFAGEEYTLYQQSYLGYGLMEARRAVHENVRKRALLSIPRSHDKDTVILHPCIRDNHTFTLDDTTFIGQSNGHLACQAHIHDILHLHVPCHHTSCSFAGTYQPSIAETFPHGEVYAFSYFYDRIAPMGYPHEFTICDLAKTADDVCRDNRERFKTIPDAERQLNKHPEYCLDLSFMHGLLDEGYGFEEHRTIKTTKKIDNVEVGWCVGVGIGMLEGVDKSCRL